MKKTEMKVYKELLLAMRARFAVMSTPWRMLR